MRAPNGGRAPRYAGEDTSPTTDRELKGWYSYGLAAEVFAVCGVGRSTTFSHPVHIAAYKVRFFPTRDVGTAGTRTRSLAF